MRWLTFGEYHERRMQSPPLPCGNIHHRTPTPTPIQRIDSFIDESLKRRMRPIPHALDPSMLDRVEMNVINVALVIIIIAYQMLPESALPDSTLASRNPHIAALLGNR